MAKKVKVFRILVEVDTNGNQMESVEVLNIGTGKIESWFGNVIEAFAWANDNGKLAVV